MSGALRLDGRVSADGISGSAVGAGGGSGGSIWLTVAQLSGAGILSVNGGNGGAASDGGGGGGRLAVEYTAAQTNPFTGLMSAYGGSGATRGGAGTIFLSPYGQLPQLVLDNGGVVGTNTPVPAYASFGLTLKGGAWSILTVPPTLTSLLIGSGTTLIPGYPYVADLTVTGDATIEQGGSLLADGWGNSANSGNSPGRYCYSNSVFFGGGGGYGGPGGAGAYPCALGGNSFGVASVANSLGSGGGDVGGGSFGGGRVSLNVAGALSVEGLISANGTAGLWPGSGGGSGGAIALTVGALRGGGQIRANGGMGDRVRGGGGGGGRIVLNYGTNLFAGTLSADGGAGWSSGGPGTIYTKANLTVPTLAPTVSGGPSGPSLSLSWFGIQGLSYQTFCSSNLHDWLPWGTALRGSNGLSELLVPIATNGQSFFRLKATN